MPISGRVSVPLGRAEGKGWVPYVHPAKVAKLEAEVERLREMIGRAFALLHEVRPIIGSDELHDRVETFLVNGGDGPSGE